MNRSVALCKYTVKAGKEQEFEALLAKHKPTLDRLGLLAEGEPYELFRGKADTGKAFYVEVLPWRDEHASDRAHGLSEVSSVWEAMGELCEDMEFPHVERIKL